ncbi:hypothetical protein [Sphingobium fluviale]|uniref:hypothetical protein n=1 Tax=Sphingobium fluviale TaxID=2506423 RepID=UPI0013E914A7|nr:hypothetical protein [Sphingobium fluviale]
MIAPLANQISSCAPITNASHLWMRLAARWKRVLSAISCGATNEGDDGSWFGGRDGLFHSRLRAFHIMSGMRIRGSFGRRRGFAGRGSFGAGFCLGSRFGRLRFVSHGHRLGAARGNYRRNAVVWSDGLFVRRCGLGHGIFGRHSLRIDLRVYLRCIFVMSLLSAASSKYTGQ